MAELIFIHSCIGWTEKNTIWKVMCIITNHIFRPQPQEKKPKSHSIRCRPLERNYMLNKIRPKCNWWIITKKEGWFKWTKHSPTIQRITFWSFPTCRSFIQLTICLWSCSFRFMKLRQNSQKYNLRQSLYSRLQCPVNYKYSRQETRGTLGLRECF